MKELPLINLVTIVHLIVLCLWGGVVATESVLELYPFRRKSLHETAIEYHFWIDLLVELPLILAVLATGTTLVALAWPLSGTHLLKVVCALTAVSANLFCVWLVVKRRGRLTAGAAGEELDRLSKRIVLCAVVGLPFAAVAAGLGFWLAYHRLLELVAG